ncbi:MAG: hypothetical protein AB7O28_24235 [Vicinamibacterales bacterium]
MTTHPRPIHLIARLVVLAGLVAGPFARVPAAVGPPALPDAPPPAPPMAWDVIVWGQNIVWGNCVPDGANIVWGNAAGRDEAWLAEIQAELEAIAEACWSLDGVSGAQAPPAGADAPPPAPPRRERGR